MYEGKSVIGSCLYFFLKRGYTCPLMRATMKEVEEILNLQPKGANAKPYQVKQVRNVILKYKLGGEDDSI